MYLENNELTKVRMERAKQLANEDTEEEAMGVC